MFHSVVENDRTKNYWLASRSVYSGYTSAYFNVRCVGIDFLNCHDLYYSEGREFTLSYRIRPMVTLTDIELIVSNPQKDGKSPERAWEIKK